MGINEYVSALSEAEASLLKNEILYLTQALADINAEKHNHKEALLYLKKSELVKGQLFNEEKSKAIGSMEMRFEIEKNSEEQKRISENEARKSMENMKRRNRLQYSGITIGLLFMGLLLLLVVRMKLSGKAAEALVFFVFLLFFEFVLVISDPWIESITGSEPFYKLMINAAFAGLIFPVHSFFERSVKRKTTQLSTMKEDGMNPFV